MGLKRKEGVESEEKEGYGREKEEERAVRGGREEVERWRGKEGYAEWVGLATLAPPPR